MYTHVLAADLGWSEDSDRVAVAVCQPGGRVEMCLGDRSDAAIHAALSRLASTDAVLVLLDVPIEGLDRLNGAATRPVDHAMAGAGIATLPASMAGWRGPQLRDAMLLAHGHRLAALTVCEMYPYAVYRVLAYLELRGLLGALQSQERGPLLDADFIRPGHPRYKRRERDRQRRWDAVAYLYRLLTHPALDLIWQGLPAPDVVRGRAEDLLVDVYEAALGGVLGALVLRGSPYAARVGDSATGEMALLADRWLRERLAFRLRITQLSTTPPHAGSDLPPSSGRSG